MTKQEIIEELKEENERLKLNQIDNDMIQIEQHIYDALLNDSDNLADAKQEIYLLKDQLLQYSKTLDKSLQTINILVQKN